MPEGAMPRDITTKEDIWRGGFGVGTLTRTKPYQDVEPLHGPKRLERRRKPKFRKSWDTTPLRESKLGTALHWAVDPWKEEEARAILDQRVIDINARDKEGQTALHVLVTQDKPEAAQLLLDYGADVNAADNVGVTPLHCAVYHKSKLVMKVLLDAGADTEAQDDKMKSPLYAAIRRNAIIPATILLEAGARVDPPEGAITSAIHFATRLKRKRILALLLDRVHPANVDFQEPDKTTPLHIAAEQGQYATVYMLLRKQANINAQDANGNTPLHLAAAELKTTTVAVLRRLGANPRRKNYDGMRPDQAFVKKYEHLTSKSRGSASLDLANYSNPLLFFYLKVKGLPGLERLNEDAEQRKAREHAVMHERRMRSTSRTTPTRLLQPNMLNLLFNFNLLELRRMGDGANWDDRFDDAKAKRAEMTRYHVKVHLREKSEKKKQAKIAGKKGKKFRMSTHLSVPVYRHTQSRANSVKQITGSFVAKLDLGGPKNQVGGLLVLFSHRLGIRRAIAFFVIISGYISLLLYCASARQSNVDLSNYVVHSPSLE